MKQSSIVLLLIISLFVIACSKTQVVKIGEQPAPAKETQTQETPTVPDTGGASVDTDSSKTPVKCVDTDDGDTTSSGKVTVTYSDKSTKDFIDECPVPNENFQTEYFCVGNDVRTKNNICSDLCVAGVCI